MSEDGKNQNDWPETPGRTSGDHRSNRPMYTIQDGCGVCTNMMMLTLFGSVDRNMVGEHNAETQNYVPSGRWEST